MAPNETPWHTDRWVTSPWNYMWVESASLRKKGLLDDVEFRTIVKQAVR